MPFFFINGVPAFSGAQHPETNPENVCRGVSSGSRLGSHEAFGQCLLDGNSFGHTY